MIRVRLAGQADAPALVALAEQVGGEEGAGSSLRRRGARSATSADT